MANLSSSARQEYLFADSTEHLKQQTDGAIITLDKEVHDYGTIKAGANGECVFKVTNTGNEPLIISFCKGSCSCTVSSCPKEPIAPGASAEITVTYNTDHVGPINKSVTINSNATNYPSKTVYIKGNVLSPANTETESGQNH
ncbi:MAG: DUF1573 domain-containing protein [Crocinitomicaceae bacterium]|nr:DUF1573 domain-containing protein [Crocinitomicaceae bacterium]